MKFGVIAAFCMSFFVLFAFGLTMTGCGCTSADEEKVTVNIGTPAIVAVGPDPYVVWDATLAINKITPKDSKVQWRDTRIIVKAADGTVLDPSSVLLDNDQEHYYLDDDAGFFYIDADHDREVSAGDVLKITNMDRSYEGGHVEFIKGGERVGSIVLPINFP